MVPSIAIVALMVFLPGVDDSDEATDQANRALLRGLEGVVVEVHDAGRNADEISLTKKRLQTLVELRLRTLGIPVLTETERTASGEKPLLRVRWAYATVGDSFVSTITVELVQWVVLHRDRTQVYSAPTWTSSEDLLLGPKSQAVDGITEYLLESVDDFANDYLAANRKGGEPDKKPEKAQGDEDE